MADRGMTEAERKSLEENPQTSDKFTPDMEGMIRRRKGKLEKVIDGKWVEVNSIDD